MSPEDIARMRRASQLIARAKAASPEAVVTHLGALQGQDILGSLWAIGLRTTDATEVSVEDAVARGGLLRTWPMRGTLHLVPTADAVWMLELLAPRAIAAALGRSRDLGLDDEAFAASSALFSAAMRGGRAVARPHLYALLDEGGVGADGQRGQHIIRRLAQQALICHGPRDGKQPTFVLLAERAPGAARMERGPALAEFARRYFTSHGPASVQDFMWWSGLTSTDAKVGLAAIAAELVEERVGKISYWLSPAARSASVTSPTVDLLPAFDEYLLGYRDRDAVLDPAHARRVCPGGNGMFMPMIVADGRVVGIWKRTLKARSVVVTPIPFGRLKTTEKKLLVAAAERYGRFLGLPATVDWG